MRGLSSSALVVGTLHARAELVLILQLILQDRLQLYSTGVVYCRLERSSAAQGDRGGSKSAPKNIADIV